MRQNGLGSPQAKCGLRLLAVTIILAGPAVAADGPYGLNTSEKVMVLLDPTQPVSQTLAKLAEAGFQSAESIVGLPPSLGPARLVSVGADPQRLAALRAVPGVLGTRQVYVLPGLRDPILSTGQIIVKFAPGTPQAQAAAIAAQHGCQIARPFPGLAQTYVLNPNRANVDAEAVVQQLKADPKVVYSHQSLMFKLNRHQAAGPIEDPLYPFQWHLNNTGQLESARVDADIDAPEAWTITMGAGATVAVIDDSVQRNHPDLADNYLTGFDFVGAEILSIPILDDQGAIIGYNYVIDPSSAGDGDPSPEYGPEYPDDVGDAHGTAVSGIIAARANSIGVRGVAPHASLVGCRIGLGSHYTSDQAIAAAFLFAESSGAMAINNSWGGPGQAILPVVPNTFLLPDLVSEAIDQVSTTGRGGRGVLVLYSSGNSAIPISYDNMYSTLPNVMSIGATLRDDQLSCYSSYGPEQSVVAPGGGLSVPRDQTLLALLLDFPSCYDTDIATTDNMQAPGFQAVDRDGDGLADPGLPVRGYNPPMRFLTIAGGLFVTPENPSGIPLVPNLSVTDFPDHDYTHHFNGTSAACPVVTGVAALVFSINPNLTAVQVRNLIEHTADKPTHVNELFDPVTGHNERYGHGRVNAFRAVQAAQAGRNWPSPVRDVQNVSSQALVQLFWTNPDDDVAGVLVARGTGQLDWAPSDGIEYTVGQQVAPGVVIVADELTDSLDQTGLPTGNYQYAVFVRNASNYYSWGRRTSFGAQGTVRPLASISASPKAGGAPLKVHFAGGGIDPTGIVSYSWNFGDGKIGSGPAIDHTYTTGGTYIATLTVRNSGGQSAQATAQIVVSGQPNAMPSVAINANPTNGVAPLVVLFQGVAQDSDGVVTRYDWNFGDGNTATGMTVEHTYIGPGTFGAALTVTDDRGGTATAVKLVTVGSLGTTAAATDPPGVLSPVTSCGTGASASILATAAGLLLFVRRRR